MFLFFLLFFLLFTLVFFDKAVRTAPYLLAEQKVEKNELIMFLKSIRILQNKAVFLGFIDPMDVIERELKSSVTRNDKYFAVRCSTNSTANS